MQLHKISIRTFKLDERNYKEKDSGRGRKWENKMEQLIKVEKSMGAKREDEDVIEVRLGE